MVSSQQGLKIGHYINYVTRNNTKRVKVTIDLIYELDIRSGSGTYSLYHYINITEHLLIELGFQETAKNSGEYFIDDSSIFRRGIRIKKHPNLDGYMFVIRDTILCTLKYLHQFQDLYSTLTGDELVLSEA